MSSLFLISSSAHCLYSLTSPFLSLPKHPSAPLHPTFSSNFPHSYQHCLFHLLTHSYILLTSSSRFLHILLIYLSSRPLPPSLIFPQSHTALYNTFHLPLSLSQALLSPFTSSSISLPSSASAFIPRTISASLSRQYSISKHLSSHRSHTSSLIFLFQRLSSIRQKQMDKQTDRKETGRQTSARRQTYKRTLLISPFPSITQHPPAY